MARIKQGFLGNASGKLGNVVFAKWRRLATARQYQPDIQDANSQAQKKQRNRMVSLLQFLMPLNKTFIRNFNAPYVQTSTPWAKAIKDNMPAVSPEGCMSLQNLSLGDPRYKAPEILSVIYNPFIDQIQLHYRPDEPPIPPGTIIYRGTSVLGKYASPDGSHSFDVRHLVCALPDDWWWCRLVDEVDYGYYINYFEWGRLWLLYYGWEPEYRLANPFLNISAPMSFQPVSIIEGFNTNVTANPVPSDAITWQYKNESNIWYLDFAIDFLKTQLKHPANYTLIYWAVGLLNNSSYQSGPVEWDLQESTFEVSLGEHGLPGSAIMLYAIFDKHGNQVSRFNRIYINKGSDNETYPFLDQIFKCVYSHPASFQLSGNQCGFCGELKTLFADFIELWEQGVIYDPNAPEPVSEFGLKIMPAADGELHTSEYKREEENTYFFDVDQEAMLFPVANSGFAFSSFSGTDAADVVPVSADVHSIKMSKARELSAVFVPQP